jgi:hypothetical protein
MHWRRNNMKKLSVFIVILVGVLFLTGCGGSKVEFDFEKTQKTIESELSGMKVIKDDTLEDVYGLDLSIMEKYVFKQNEDGDFYAIIKTSDVDTVKDNMNDYFEKVQKFNKNYSPERIQILEDRLEKEIDDYLVYIVAKDADSIYEKITKNM